MGSFGSLAGITFPTLLLTTHYLLLTTYYLLLTTWSPTYYLLQALRFQLSWSHLNQSCSPSSPGGWWCRQPPSLPTPPHSIPSHLILPGPTPSHFIPFYSTPSHRGDLVVSGPGASHRRLTTDPPSPTAASPPAHPPLSIPTRSTLPHLALTHLTSSHLIPPHPSSV